jgi:hypothetical protein
VHVTKENREKYIYNYMRFFLITSIREQFQAFKAGFLRVCSGKILVREWAWLQWERVCIFRWSGCGFIWICSGKVLVREWVWRLWVGEGLLWESIIKLNPTGVAIWCFQY